jgi:hypothetical protein
LQWPGTPSHVRRRAWPTTRKRNSHQRREAKEDNEQEIVSFCAEWMDFSIDQTSVEDLDRRLELAIAHWAGIRPLCVSNCNEACNINCRDLAPLGG